MDDGKKPARDSTTALQILLVEHDRADPQRMQQALACTGAEFFLKKMRTADEALTWLRESIEAPESAAPDLILIDLHLPGSTAQRLLAEIRCHDQLSTIPVVALAAPLSEDDSLEAFDLAAWTCIRKTAELAVFADRLRQAMRCCLGDFPLGIGTGDPIGRSQVAEALIFKLGADRSSRKQPPANANLWQPIKRETSFWRRRRSA